MKQYSEVELYEALLETSEKAKTSVEAGRPLPLYLFPTPQDPRQVFEVTSTPFILINRTEMLRGNSYVTEVSVSEVFNHFVGLHNVNLSNIRVEYQENERKKFSTESEDDGPFLSRNMIALGDFRIYWGPGAMEQTFSEIGDNDSADQQKGAVTDLWKRFARRSLGYGVPILRFPKKTIKTTDQANAALLQQTVEWRGSAIRRIEYLENA